MHALLRSAIEIVCCDARCAHTHILTIDTALSRHSTACASKARYVRGRERGDGQSVQDERDATMMPHLDVCPTSPTKQQPVRALPWLIACVWLVVTTYGFWQHYRAADLMDKRRAISSSGSSTGNEGALHVTDMMNIMQRVPIAIYKEGNRRLDLYHKQSLQDVGALVEDITAAHQYVLSVTIQKHYFEN